VVKAAEKEPGPSLPERAEGPGATEERAPDASKEREQEKSLGRRRKEFRKRLSRASEL